MSSSIYQRRKEENRRVPTELTNRVHLYPMKRPMWRMVVASQEYNTRIR
jgi:hypothetical protein